MRADRPLEHGSSAGSVVSLDALRSGASTPGYAADGSEFNSTNPTDAESESARSDEQTAIQGIVQNMLRHRK